MLRLAEQRFDMVTELSIVGARILDERCAFIWISLHGEFKQFNQSVPVFAHPRRAPSVLFLLAETWIGNSNAAQGNPTIR